MPIYAYKCESCGFSKDVLQKMTDPKLTLCPACGAEAFQKQVTAAGFQLKGSGWYVTDFRGGDSGTKPPAGKSDGDAKPASGEGAAADSTKSDSPGKADTGAAASSSSSGPASATASSSAAPVSAPAAATSPAAKRKD
jgi:putative FmdB family regulatory protein